MFISDQPAAMQEVLLPPVAEKSPPRERRQPAAKVLETVTERLEPAEKGCPRCGKEKCEIGCEKSERFDYIPAKIVRHEILRPKLACSCGAAGSALRRCRPVWCRKAGPGPELVAPVLLSTRDVAGSVLLTRVRGRARKQELR